MLMVKKRAYRGPFLERGIMGFGRFVGRVGSKFTS